MEIPGQENNLNNSWWLSLQELRVHMGKVKLEWEGEKLCSGW